MDQWTRVDNSDNMTSHHGKYQASIYLSLHFLMGPHASTDVPNLHVNARYPDLGLHARTADTLSVEPPL